MRTLVVSTFLTLDGVMQAPADPGRTTTAGDIVRGSFALD